MEGARRTRRPDPQFAASRSMLRTGSLSAAAARLLDRWTRNRPVGAKDAAIAVLAFQSSAAAPAVVEQLAGVRRHPLGRRVVAVRTPNGGIEDHVAHDTRSECASLKLLLVETPPAPRGAQARSAIFLADAVVPVDFQGIELGEQAAFGLGEMQAHGCRL